MKSSLFSEFSSNAKLFLKFVLCFMFILIFVIFNSFNVRQEANMTRTGQLETIFKADFSLLNRTVIVVMHESTGVGYANRLYTFINSVAVSLLTDSLVVFVNWPEIERLIRFKSQKYVLNKPMEKYIKRNASRYEFPLQTDNTWGTEKKVSSFYTELPLDRDIYEITSFGPVFFELLTNEKYYYRLAQSGLVSKRTLQDAKQNKSIESLLQIGFEFGGSVLRKIWLPSFELKKHIDRFVRDYFNGHYVIGIQIRQEFLKTNEIDFFVECAKFLEMTIKNGTIRSGFKWFVSTDTQEIADRLKRKYPDRVVTGSGTIGHIKDGTGHRRAIIDNEFLSLCDDLIITGGSTFGFVAAMRMGRMPVFFNGMRNSRTCERMSFTNYATRPEGYAVI